MTPAIFEPANFFFLSIIFLVLFGYFLSRLGSCRVPAAQDEPSIEQESPPNEPKAEEARQETEPKVSIESKNESTKTTAKRKPAGRPKNAVPTKKAAKKKPRDR